MPSHHHTNCPNPFISWMGQTSKGMRRKTELAWGEKGPRGQPDANLPIQRRIGTMVRSPIPHCITDEDTTRNHQSWCYNGCGQSRGFSASQPVRPTVFSRPTSCGLGLSPAAAHFQREPSSKPADWTASVGRSWTEPSYLYGRGSAGSSGSCLSGG